MDSREVIDRDLIRYSANSYIVSRFDKSLTMLEQGHHKALVHSGITVALLQELCPFYSRCNCEQSCIYCDSGRDSAPRRGNGCSRCIAGQVTVKGEWIGNDPERLPQKKLTLHQIYLAEREKENV